MSIPSLRFGNFRWIMPALVFVLSALLVARILVDRNNSQTAVNHKPANRVTVPSLAPAQAPAAHVPKPTPLNVAELPAPRRWSWFKLTRGSEPLDFSFDLDRIAPMGDGTANAAVWFRDFANDDGSRALEFQQSNTVSVTLFGSPARVLPPDHPLLREAEPWVDQATCRFYPDIWTATGPDVLVPNFMFAITLARSWAARGAHETDPERAREDFRRAVRLGRLYMQDDIVMIQHIAGWSCVAYGLRGLNDLARRQGDAPMVAATSIALGDFEAMRQAAARWEDGVKIADALREGPFGWGLSFDDAQIGRIVDAAEWSPLRCMRAEALIPLDAIAHEGTRAQRRAATAVLAKLTHDSDPRLAAVATHLTRARYERNQFFGTPD